MSCRTGNVDPVALTSELKTPNNLRAYEKQESVALSTSDIHFIVP